jgi:alpha-galactosidase
MPLGSWINRFALQQHFISLIFLAVPYMLHAQRVKKLWLDELPIKSYSQGIPAVVSKSNQGGGTIQIAGTKFEHGIGVASTSILSFQLSGNAKSFQALVGVDDEGSKTLGHRFFVVGDKKILFESGLMHHGERAKMVDVDLRGINRLGLLVLVQDEGHTKVYSNWADACFEWKGDGMPSHIPNDGEKYILTPAPSLLPSINSPLVFGARAGNPILFSIVASGKKPLKFHAEGLPKELKLDTSTGMITGILHEKKVYPLLLRVSNALGSNTQSIRLVISDQIALTPPMGWNGWNSWARNIDREKVLASSKAMVEMGLRDHGWTYINIDDAWQGERSGPNHSIQANAKFPAFKSMIDSIHQMGLKLGVYSTPMIVSYAGFPGGSSLFPDGKFPDSIVANKRAFRYVGPYTFEKQDAKQFAEWGVDFLKYDWRIELPSALRMAEALKQSGRDIVYSISNSAPFSQVTDWKRITNMWRTGPDIRDSWHGLYTTTFTLNKWTPYSGPGHWNDPDMMILGNVTTGSDMHPTRLTPDEQYSHVSLFALLSAPMLIGCPIDQLDPFTLNLLTNDEVIAIDQDPAGQSAQLVQEKNGVQVWLKKLEDGDYAVGLFNTANYGKDPQSYFRWGDEKPVVFSFDPSSIGLKGNWNFRDLWRQKDFALNTSVLDLIIPHHGVQFLKLTAHIPSDTIMLHDLSLANFSEGIRPVKSRMNYQGDSMRIAGRSYQNGIGLQSISVLPFELNGKGLKFHALVGADDMGNKNLPIQFHVLGDGRLLYKSDYMNVGDPSERIDIDLRGIKRLGLLVTDSVGGIANKRTYGNFVNAFLVMQKGYKPEQVPNDQPAYIQTPKSSPKPSINAPRRFGASPGRPFLFTIAASGERPMQFSATGLPAGLKLDSRTGIITGSVFQKGNHRVMLRAKNKLGVAEQELMICIGDTIALTPPIGWNGWNSWAHKLDREKVLASARAMSHSGLSQYGWTYINIDDTWQGIRSAKDSSLQPNEKFGDFHSMVDTIHQLGLKAGLYSTPYISTYAGYPGGSSDYPVGGETHELIKKDRQPYMRIGPHRFEEQDAKQMARWGFDFIKYDWRIDVNSAERMSNALKKSGRDILLSISNSAPFEKANDWVRTTQMFRTGPDIRDSWNSLYMTTFSLDKWYPYTGPGHWPDPDMMIVGNVSTGAGLHPTRLTPDEQYSHVSLYALLASPMLIGCPIESLDSFTMNLLTNAEVIAINQDPLGKGGRKVMEENGVQIWLKEMSDGSYALGLFHTADYGKTPASYFRWGNELEKIFHLNLSRLGLKGSWKIRDVWRQQDIQQSTDKVSSSIPHHGVKLFRLYPNGNGSNLKSVN